MKTLRTLQVLCLFIALCITGTVHGEEHFFTYMGITLGGGVNQIEYTDWFTDHQETASLSGSYYSGGILFAVFVRELVGEFSIQYMANANDSVEGAEDTSVQHLLYTFTGKYAYPLGDMFAVTGGLGLYIEAPPATARYDGGGGVALTLGCVIQLSFDWKIIVDLNGRYGQFGMGQDSTKQSYGMNIGVVYNVGRI